jgi:hypothetical protein
MPEPVAQPAASVKSAAASAGGFAALRATLDEIETDYASMEKRLTEAEKCCAAWQTAASGAMLQLKAIAVKDTQAQQEMDYEALAKTINELVASPRDIELISALARRAQALKRVIELHRSAMEAIADATKSFDPLLSKG